ncbi:MAG TPA: TAXI family TRAP transporter solute-binding subunit [Thermodesulfobacteriota bacterium]
MRSLTRRRWLAAAVTSAAPLLAGHAPYRQWHVYRQRRLVLVVNEADGTAVRLGDAAAAALAAGLPESRALLATAASARDLVALLRSGQLDMAVLPADEAVAAYTGAPDFGGWPVALTAVARLGSVRLHLLVPGDRAVRRAAGLGRGPVGVGVEAYRTAAVTERVLAASGASAARLEPLAVGEAAHALRERRIEAFAWLDDVPSATVRRLQAEVPAGLRLVDQGELLPRLAERHGAVYREEVVPAGTYPGGTSDVRVAALPYLLVCRPVVADEVAHDVAAALGAPAPDPGPLPPHPGLAHDAPAVGP